MKISATSNLNGHASTISGHVDNILSDIEKITNLSQEVLNYWQGEDANAFLKIINEEVVPKLHKYYECLVDYVNYVSKVEQIYLALEENYDKKIEL